MGQGSENFCMVGSGRFRLENGQFRPCFYFDEGLMPVAGGLMWRVMRRVMRDE